MSKFATTARRSGDADARKGSPMTTDAPTLDMISAGPVAAPDDAARNKLVIGLLLVSAFVVILNETIMGVALPHLMDDLDITASAAQWLTTAFMLTMAVVIP